MGDVPVVKQGAQFFGLVIEEGATPTSIQYLMNVQRSLSKTTLLEVSYSARKPATWTT